MSVRVLIIEDEMLVAEDIATDLSEYGFVVVDTLISGEECLEKFELLNPDVVIMDIHIKGKWDGIETARLLNENKNVPIIYLTANSDKNTIQRLLSVFPAPFISKPYNSKDLMIAIELAFAKSNSQNFTVEKQKIDEVIFIKTSTQYKKVKLKNILYLEASGSYAKVITAEEEYLVSNNLSHFEEIVHHPSFKRIHRSYIVNIDYVDALEGNSLVVNHQSLPVSKAFQKEIMNLFKKL